MAFNYLPFDVVDFEKVVRDQDFGFEIRERLPEVPESSHSSSDDVFDEYKGVLSDIDTGFSQISETEKEFEIRLQVKPYNRMDNIKVSSTDNTVHVHFEHPFIKEGKGEVSRTFKRIYVLPKRCNPNTLVTFLKSDGALVLNCKKNDDQEEKLVTVGVCV